MSLTPHQTEVIARLLDPDSGATDNERAIARMLLGRKAAIVDTVLPASLIYYVGCWGKTSGHYVFLPNGSQAPRGSVLSPWGTRDYDYPVADGTVAQWMEWNGEPKARSRFDGRRLEHEGVRYHFQKDGWTLVSWWDRSADHRFGSVAAFALHGTYSADDAEQEARRLYPSIFARMDLHLGRTTEAEEYRARVIRALAEVNQAQWEQVGAVLRVAK